jgi:hypothetical protein
MRSSIDTVNGAIVDRKAVSSDELTGYPHNGVIYRASLDEYDHQLDPRWLIAAR